VVVVAKQLEENVAGATYLTTHTPVVIELDCGLARTRYKYVAILHELYHALGIGHVEPARYDELMGAPPTRAPPPYPSSLDALALWELWFSGRTYRPGVEVMFTILRIPLRRPAALRRHDTGAGGGEGHARAALRWAIQDVRKNTRMLYNMTRLVASLREDVRELSGKNEALRAENARLAGRVGELESLLAGRETALANLSRVAEELRAALGEREGQVASLVAKVAELQEKLERAEAWGQVLFYTVLVLMPLALTVPVALALIRRRERR
jgi:uncharacterized coiled-coil protein SlyX